jgi:predicted outer membrane repeat protein
MLLVLLLATVGAAPLTGTSGNWTGLGSWAALKVAVQGAGSTPLTITVPGPDGLFDCDDYDSEIEVKAGANITVLGNGVVLDAATKGRLFNVAAGASLTLHQLTLQQGRACLHVSPHDYGGAVYNAGEFRAFDCTFAHNFACDFGGAIYNEENAQCTLNRNTFPEIGPNQNLPTSVDNKGKGIVRLIGCNGIPSAAMAPDSNNLPSLPICMSCNTLTAMCSAKPDSVLLPGDCAESCK